MKNRIALLGALALVTVGPAALAQQPERGVIVGGVVDSSGAPVAEADVFLRGAARRVRTDSAGRYRFGDLEPGSYAMIARKVGYRFIEAEVVVRAGAEVRQDFTIGRQVWLPAVEVSARAECPLGETIRGFFCRQLHFTGTYLDYPEIDFKGVTYTAELFRGIRGFRVGTRRTDAGWMEPVPVRIGGYCVRYIVDGRASSRWSSVPLNTKDITAIEVYVRPDSIPPEVRREMLFGGSRSRACDVVVIWTRHANK